MMASCDPDCTREEIEQLKLKADKCIYTVAVKGKIWNSLESKQTIKDQLKVSTSVILIVCSIVNKNDKKN